MSAAKIANLLALSLLFTPLTAHAEATAPLDWGGKGDDVLIVLGSPPLWASGAFAIDEPSMSIRLDGQKACAAEMYFDSDNGWICKTNRLHAGQHAIAVAFTDKQGRRHALSAKLNLRAADKKFEFPDNPLKGEQFWCVSISMTAVRIIPKSDDRCQTD